MISRDANGLADRGNNRRRAYHKAGPVGQDNIPAKAGIWIHIFTGMTQGVFGGLFAYQSSPTFRGRGYEDFKGISRFVNIGIGLWTLDLDAPGVLPSVIPVINTHKSRQQLAIDLIRREQPTVRQLLRKMVAGGRRILFGSAQDIVDNFEHWFRAGAADGFNIMFPDLHGSVDRFVEQVVPELQRRGLFRTSHEGRTLRDNLGLARPVNRFSVRSGERLAATTACAPDVCPCHPPRQFRAFLGARHGNARGGWGNRTKGFAGEMEWAETSVRTAHQSAAIAGDSRSAMSGYRTSSSTRHGQDG